MSKAPYLAFVIGAAVGGAAAWFYAKKKYEALAQEEIDSVKEVFAKKNPEKAARRTDIHPDAVSEKPNIMEYAAKLKDSGYVGYDTCSKTSEKKEEPTSKPYVIPPEEFGEKEGYAQLSFMYYADGTLADDGDQIVDNIEELVGEDSLSHFGEYEDDSVYVRNDVRKIDFEILRSLRTYAEIIEESPYKAGI